MQRTFFCGVFSCLTFLVSSGPLAAAEMTFQMVNNTDRALSMKLFSRGESKQVWPGNTRAYSLRPDTAIQRVKITCQEGEPICWGAWEVVASTRGEIGSGGQRATSVMKMVAGVGDRGLRECDKCCHVCQDGTMTPPVLVSTSSNVGADVK